MRTVRQSPWDGIKQGRDYYQCLLLLLGVAGPSRAAGYAMRTATAAGRSEFDITDFDITESDITNLI